MKMIDTAYQQALKEKELRVMPNGFDVDLTDLNPSLKPFQKFCVQLALKVGRYALFEDCGLGKTFQAGEWATQVVNKTGKPVIMLAPLAVTGQTISECAKWGIEVHEWIDGMETMHEVPPGIYITNYENLHKIPVDDFSGVVLDESSILKNEDGATRNLLIETFAQTAYRLCCTATPSPNDPMELGNHSEFLGWMSRAEMLAMFFVHDGGETSKWRLKGHSKQVFYRWVNTWAKMLAKPSDIGFDDDGYDLPGLNMLERQIKTSKRDNGRLYNDTAISATNFNEELRLTKVDRMEAVADIVNDSVESFVIWIKHNEEGELLRKLIPSAIEVKGSDSPEYKKSKLLGFANNEFRVLITKVKIGGFGMNYQNCHNMVFASPDFSFEGIYQAIRRMLRFGQLFAVNAWMVTTDTMENVMQSFKRKQDQHVEMQGEMQECMIETLADLTETSTDYKEYKSDFAHWMYGDCIEMLDTKIEDDSIGFSIWSPPFPDLYTYSNDIRDLGNCKNYDQFRKFFAFIPPKLYRKIWSGRNVAIHCMDTPIQKGKEGFIGLRDFSGMIIEEMLKAGFIYHSRVTIWKNPVVEMQRTKALGLLHKQVRKDSAMSRVGIPDYLLVFRKPGEAIHPIKCDISVDTWQQYASPVWMDIDYGDTNNARAGRDEEDEKHICPLQKPTIRRATHLWSNKGDKVLTIFGGIASEVDVAIELGRIGVGIELKDSYWGQGLKNIKKSEESLNQTALFNAIKEEAA